ncbi:hypothetical protein STEG23_020352 [Scotinomys teguina]
MWKGVMKLFYEIKGRTQQAILRDIYVNTHTYMHAIMINGERGHEFEGEQVFYNMELTANYTVFYNTELTASYTVFYNMELTASYTVFYNTELTASYTVFYNTELTANYTVLYP